MKSWTEGKVAHDYLKHADLPHTKLVPIHSLEEYWTFAANIINSIKVFTSTPGEELTSESASCIYMLWDLNGRPDKLI